MNAEQALAADIRSVSSRLEAPESKAHDRLFRPGRSIELEHRPSVLFRHSGWERDRKRMGEAFGRTDQPDHRIEAFKDCGYGAYVLRSVDDPSRYRVAGSCCHDRFCLPCATERSCVIAGNVAELIQTKEVRFLTLTIKTSTEPLSESLTKLYRSFQALRRRAFWKRAVRGGVAFLELKYSGKAERWHPHLHCLIEGTWLDQKLLKRAWYAITTDSFVVDIRRPPNVTSVVRYVTKYASKPFDRSFTPQPHLLDEAIVALKGRKLCVTFGTWRGLLLTKQPEDGCWEHVASLDVVIANAAHGDAECIAIMQCLTDRDLSSLYERAPPWRPDPLPLPPPDVQLDWMGTWLSDGSYRYPVGDPC